MSHVSIPAPLCSRDGLIHAHILYLWTTDPCFRRWWGRLSPEARLEAQRCLQALNRLTADIREMESAGRAAEFRRLVDERLRTAMRALPNYDVVLEPTPWEWAHHARDAVHNRWVCDRVFDRVQLRLARSGVRARVYGGLKRRAVVRQRIRNFGQGAELDLWDVIRLRVVASSLPDVASSALAIAREFGSSVIRFRNYYVSPRNERDLYRAIHVTVAEEEQFVEIQVMTLAREAVCECDHGIAFKKEVSPLGPFHLEWLRQLSIAANAFDGLESRAAGTCRACAGACTCARGTLLGADGALTRSGSRRPESRARSDRR